MSRVEIGTTLSQKELVWRGIETDLALQELKSLGMTWVRLGCYWDEIEKQPGEYDFRIVEKIVGFCEKNKIKVVMCLGMKSPRWPEFHIPPYKTNLTRINLITPEDNKELLDEVILFNTKCVRHFGKSKAIVVWQIENEAMDPSGPQDLSISSSFLAEEIKAIRKIDSRKILISLWGNKLLTRNHFPQAIDLADIVGLDIYPKVPIKTLLGFILYKGANNRELEYVTRLVKHSRKELWITELQTEPWEASEQAKNSTNPPSFTPIHFEQNLKQVLPLKPKVILLWGFEYWLWKKQQGDNRYMDAAKDVIQKYK